MALAAEPAGASVEAWAAAGECWRRDDRPSRARRALEMALGLPQPAAHRQQGVARLAAVLGELGEGASAVQLLTDAARQGDGPGRAAVLDTLIGTLLGYGRVDQVRPLVAELREEGGGLAVAFREGQLARLDGALDAASTAFRRVAQALDGHPGAEAGVAAAEMELAEIAVLQGRPLQALAPFEHGRRLHLEAGRRALAYRCEAGRVRAAVEADLTVVSPWLEEGLTLANDRGMRLLALDLGLARGMGRAATDLEGALDDLRRAVREADALGTRLRGGRARLQILIRGGDAVGDRRELWASAVELLTDHVVLHRRALALEPSI